MTDAPPISSPPPPSQPPPPHIRDLRDPDPGWGAGRVFGGLGFLLAIVIVQAGIVAAIDPGIESLAARLTLQASLAGSLVVTALLFASRDLRSFAPLQMLGWRRPTGPWASSMAIAYFAYVGAALVIAALLQPHQDDVTRDLGFGEGVLGSIAAGVLIVLVAPISEEIFFRGFLLGGLRRSMPFWFAAALSSGIWGLFHYTDPDSWGVVLQLSIFGLALSWLYRRTGSIWPTIGVHLINNAIAFTLLTS
jgi:membrane protease YdiL (CAAX protease family)